MVTARGSRAFTPGELKYNGVQVLRFVAALLVVLTHTSLYANERLDDSFEVWSLGIYGVYIFFAISGFVMMYTSPKFVRAEKGWALFGVRRLIRIVPMYWIATTAKLAALIIIPSAVLHSALDPGKIVMSYLFIPSRNIDGNVEPLLGVGWTLFFEMFFYLVFTIALLMRLNVLYFCTIVMTIFALGTIWRGGGEAWHPFLVYLSPLVMYFVVGMFIARYALDRKVVNLVAGLAYSLAVWATIAAFHPSGQFNVSGFVGQVLVTLIVLCVVLAEPFIGRSIPKPLIFLGDASYSLYLFHPIIAPLVPTALAVVGLRSAGLSVVVSVALVVAVTAVIYGFIERPITNKLLASTTLTRKPVEVRP